MMWRREIPPTAGLPIHWRDLAPSGAAPSLAACMAEQLVVPTPLPTCSGTAALMVALSALHRRAPARDLVVVPAYTCPLVAIAVRQLGLRLRLCDLAPGHFDLDPQALASACREDTLAVVPTHLARLVADVTTAVSIARYAGTFVIEDAAQALGARRGGQSVGLQGDAGFFSLAAGKGLSIYEGGLLIARDPALRESMADTASALLPRDRRMELLRCAELIGLTCCYRPSLLGLAYGLPLRRALRRGDSTTAVGDRFPMRAPLHRVGRWRLAVGTRAAARWPDFLASRRALARRRIERLRRIDGLHVFDEAPDSTASWPCLLLRMPDEAHRDAALAQLWQSGLGVTRLFAHALPDYGYLADCVPRTTMPRATDFAARTLTVSNSPWLDEARFEHICDTLDRILRA
jgi:dTDP-4-amino-4,6-dideoxygalactose transaminase